MCVSKSIFLQQMLKIHIACSHIFSSHHCPWKNSSADLFFQNFCLPAHSFGSSARNILLINFAFELKVPTSRLFPFCLTPFVSPNPIFLLCTYFFHSSQLISAPSSTAIIYLARDLLHSHEADSAHMFQHAWFHSLTLLSSVQ